MAPSHRNVVLVYSIGAVAAGLLGATLWYQQTAADNRRAMETRVNQLFDECDEVLVEWIVHESGRMNGTDSVPKSFDTLMIWTKRASPATWRVV